MADTADVKRVLVTPEMAEEWLSKNEANRPLRRSSLTRMANDMGSGLWLETNPQPIIFDITGALIDGQHRLSGLVKAGRPLWFWVATNVPRHTQLVIDDHIRRHVHDFAKWEMPGLNITSRHVACARVMIQGLTGTQWAQTTRSVLYRFMRDHFSAIEFALGVFSKRIPHVTSAVTLGVLARAYYTQDAKKLRRFAEVLESGMVVDPSESAAVMVYRFMVERGRGRPELYAKTERSLMAFVHGEPLTRVYATKEELFPLPEESQAPEPSDHEESSDEPDHEDRLGRDDTSRTNA